MSGPSAFTTMNDWPVSAGDICLMDLDPIRGTEQAGRRPVIIISINAMNTRSKRVIVCPITSNMQPWTTKVPLPSGLATRGMVLTDQVRSVDRTNRMLRHIETTPAGFVEVVRSHVGRLIGLELADPA